MLRLKDIEQKEGIQPAVRELAELLAVIEKETPVDAEKAELTTDLTGDNNDLDYTAQTAGAAGNDISVEYIDPNENDADLAIEVVDKAIKVYLSTGGAGAIETTANEIITAIEADAEASGLVAVATADGSSGEGVVTELAETSLEGGVDATVADEGKLLFDDDNLYIATSDVDITTEDGWREISLRVLS